MRLTLQYEDAASTALSHCVRVTLPDSYAKPCSVLVKSFLKSYRQKHGALLDATALDVVRDGVVCTGRAVADVLRDGDVLRLVAAAKQIPVPPPVAAAAPRSTAGGAADDAAASRTAGGDDGRSMRARRVHGAAVETVEVAEVRRAGGIKGVKGVKGAKGAGAPAFVAADPALEIAHAPCVGEFLARTYRAAGTPATYDASRDRAAVIVETRPTPWLVLAIRNALAILAEDGCTVSDGRVRGWNLVIVGDGETLDYVRGRVDGEYLEVPLDAKLPSNAAFSALLLEPRFWHALEHDHVLIFQTDCVLLRPPLEKDLDWAMIGAVCGGFEDVLEYSCNGGLSLRRCDAMVACLETMTLDERDAPEDVAFSARLIRIDAAERRSRLADKDDAFKFAIEEWGDHGTCVGVHGTDKGFLGNQQLRAILRTAARDRRNRANGA